MTTYHFRLCILRILVMNGNGLYPDEGYQPPNQAYLQYTGLYGEDVHKTGYLHANLRSAEKSPLLFSDKKSKLSKDQKEALKHGISTDDLDHLISCPIDEFNDYMQEKNIPETSVTTLKDIRRRGKNKVAAQNCRKRKIDQVEDLKEKLTASKIEGEKCKEANTKMKHERAKAKSDMSARVQDALSSGFDIQCTVCSVCTEGCYTSHDVRPVLRQARPFPQEAR